MATLNARRPNNFQPRRFGTIASTHSKKRAITELDDAVGLQHKHLCMVPLSNDSQLWWPCLVFSDPNSAFKIIKNAMAAIESPKLQQEYYCDLMDAIKNDGILNSKKAVEVTILLGVGVKKRAYFNLATTCNKIEFNAKGSAFMDKMVKDLAPIAKTTPFLESALLQTYQIFKYMLKSTSTTIATSATTTVAAQEESNVIEREASTLRPSPRKKSRTVGPVTAGTNAAPPPPAAHSKTTEAKSATTAAASEIQAVPTMTTATTTEPPVGAPHAQPPAGSAAQADPEEDHFSPAGAEHDGDEKAIPESEENENSTVSTVKSTASKKPKAKGKQRGIKTPTKSPDGRKVTPKSTKKGQRYKQTGEMVRIPRWPQVSVILKDCGYEFDTNVFARPFGNPKRNKAAKLGVDYFATEESFRAYCCAHGFDYVSVPPEEDDQQVVNIWSRYSILGAKFLDPQARVQKVPELSMTKLNTVRVLRNSLGFKYEYGLQNGYVFPGDDKSMCIEDEDMWMRLARFGLPEACTFEKSDEGELLAVLQRIITTHVDKYDPKFEERIDPVIAAMNDGALPEREEAFSEINLDNVGETEALQNASDRMVPVTDAEAIANCNRAPKTVSPRNLRKNLKQNFDKQAPSSLVQSKDTTDPTEDSTVSQTVNNAKPCLEADETGEDVGDAPTAMQEDFIPQSALECSDVVLTGTSVEQKLKSCLEAMRVSQEDALTVGATLSAALGSIGRFMKEVVDSRGLKNNAFIHVCGAPGVGKTAGVRACVKKMQHYWDTEKETSIDKSHLEPPRFVFLKGSEFQNLTIAQAMKKTFDSIGGNKMQLRRPSDLDKSSKAAVILVLDEIDMLISKPGTEEYLRAIVGYAADENMRLALVGISNSIDNAGLNDLGFSGKRVVFRTYSQEDLVSIITSKIGTSVVDKCAVAFLAKKVAATSGDVRTMLGLVACAIEACREKLSQAKLSVALIGPVVKMPHALVAVKKQNPKTKELIDSLPKYEKFTLCCAFNFAQAWLGKELSLGRLFADCKEAFGMECPLTIEDFKGILERLVDSGLLKLDIVAQNFNAGDLTQAQLRFDDQLEDVISALEEGIEKEAFYQRMKERCQEMKRSLGQSAF